MRGWGWWAAFGTAVPVFVFASAMFVWFPVQDGGWQHGYVAVIFALSAVIQASGLCDLMRGSRNT